jgi:hypothetical protein
MHPSQGLLFNVEINRMSFYVPVHFELYAWWFTATLRTIDYEHSYFKSIIDKKSRKICTYTPVLHKLRHTTF